MTDDAIEAYTEEDELADARLLLEGARRKIDDLLAAAAGANEFIDIEAIRSCNDALDEAIKSLEENRQFYQGDWGFLTSIVERYNERLRRGYDLFWETFNAWDAPEEFSMTTLTEFVNPYPEDAREYQPHLTDDLIRRLWLAVRDRDLKKAEILFDEIADTPPPDEDEGTGDGPDEDEGTGDGPDGHE